MNRDKSINLSVAALIFFSVVPPIVQTVKSVMLREITFERVKKQPFTHTDGIKQAIARRQYMIKSGEYTTEEMRRAFANDVKFMNIVVN